MKRNAKNATDTSENTESENKKLKSPKTNKQLESDPYDNSDRYDSDDENQSSNEDEEFLENDEIVLEQGKEFQNGKKEGFGIVRWKSGMVYNGEFKNDLKHGRGVLNFPDESYIEGNFENDEVNGKAIFYFLDGSFIEGTFVDGELHGYCKEYASQNCLSFEGYYENNVRHGFGSLHLEDGGMLRGSLVQGEFDGDVMYVYPDKSYCLAGTWKNNEMENSQFRKFDFNNNKVKEIIGNTELWYSFDESTAEYITKNPLLPEPWEELRVFVAESLLNAAGEGLFAKMDFEINEVVCFYNGIRTDHETINKKDWEDCGNTITVNEDIVLDVPKRFSSIDRYCSSLGHKANHRNNPNCKYDIFSHPIYGDIKCIRTIKSVKKNEELYCYYDYESHNETTPAWYFDHLSKKNNDKNKL